MLKSLYDYAVRHKLTLPAGYVNKTVKAYILLYGDGSFQDVEMGTDDPIPAPDIGSLANGKDKSNVLLEKRSVVLPEAPTAKSQFFLDALRSGGETEPMLAICAKALEDEDTAAQIRKRLDEQKIKPSDRISFKVDYRSILSSEKTLEWWQGFRQQFRKTGTGQLSVCLITGERTVPAVTTTPISGLHAVGGHARGDALICFDKNAFCSYGLKKAANAPVSEEAFAAVKVALDELLNRAPTLAGMKFVHWFDQSVEPEEDPIICSGDFGGLMLEEIEDWEDSDDSDRDLIEQERSAQKQADALVNSVTSGERAELLDQTSYFILLLTGVGGRVMIRRYERGSYRDLKEKLDQWHEDLKLIHPRGSGWVSSCKLTARLMCLLKRQKVDSQPFERLKKELSGITPAILTAILSGGPLPDAVAMRALAFIRSQMLEDESGGLEQKRICCAYQWLKVWLIRNRQKGDYLMEAYHTSYPSVAYHCGAMMAVYEAIQNEAMPNVNVTITQRYYASAIQTPALVIGRLSQASVHHLEKVENLWLANYFRDWLKQISAEMKGSIPATLNLEQQSEFALGYYQMGAELNKQKNERIAAKKEREAAAKQ